MNEFSDLELFLLNALAEKYSALKSHLPLLKVKDREITNSGMYVHLEYLDSDGKIDESDINALFSNEEIIQIKNLKKGLGYLIDVTDGKIMHIEFMTYGEKWNGEIGEYTIFKDE